MPSARFPETPRGNFPVPEYPEGWECARPALGGVGRPKLVARIGLRQPDPVALFPFLMRPAPRGLAEVASQGLWIALLGRSQACLLK